uniref:G protein-coupled receptor 160 n=2 Tax=Gasterosteus aculeatus aculeatus TaxID=481459 RepID=G3PXS9_GASAC
MKTENDKNCQQQQSFPKDPLSLENRGAMIVSITCILLGLGGKCLLDWVLVFLQRTHICQGFLGVFALSLAVVDTVLTLFVATLHAHGYVALPGLTLTRYHACLLVQIFGQICSALQWPVAFVAGLDHFSMVTRSQPVAGRARSVVWVLVTGLLWYLAAVYVFLLSDFTPVMEDVPHNRISQCWVFPNTQTLQVSAVLLLTLGCGAWRAGRGALLSSDVPGKGPITDERKAPSRRDVAHQAVHAFLDTWAPFLLFLAVLFLLPVGLPAHLCLNTGWLCFLNSLLIATVLCAVCPVSWITQGPAAVPPDSFSEWRFRFVLRTEGERHRANTELEAH